MWEPSASMHTLRKRAALIRHLRETLHQHGYLEVETPVIGRHGSTDVFLASMTTNFRNQTYYLQTSPEFHMKRLLAAGSGPIFQIARVFRDDELGRWHNPEFSMLEWYRPYIDYHQLLLETADIIQSLLHCAPLIRISYQQIFLNCCSIDPFNSSLEQLNTVLTMHNLKNILPTTETDQDQGLFLLMTHIIEPWLAQQDNLFAIYDFPMSQAALAQIFEERALRFEIYYKGVELANGFAELTDPTLQHQRFINDLHKRQQLALPSIPLDQNLLAALEHGLPMCCGVALGLDRLIALTLNQDNIAQAMSFDWSRA